MIRNNWKELLLIGFVLTLIPFFIYDQMTLDEDLTDIEKWRTIRETLKKEYKDLALPPTTAVNKFEDLSELRSSIGMTMRYRTEINNPEFVDHMTKELNKKGWSYYGQSGDGSYEFCRGKFDASLFYEGNTKLFGNAGKYYQLYFGFGQRSSSDKLPDKCK